MAEATFKSHISKRLVGFKRQQNAVPLEWSRQMWGTPQE